MENTIKKQADCLPETKADENETFNELFVQCYRTLQEYGEKKIFQLELQSHTNPPVSIGTFRGYCNNPALIPERNREFYITLMAQRLFFHLQKKLTVSHNFIREVEPLLERLNNATKREINNI